MYYPPQFSSQEREPVELALITAERAHRDRAREWESESPFDEDKSLKRCILDVFGTYAYQVIELAKKGVLSIDQLRDQAMEGLRLLSIEIAGQTSWPGRFTDGGYLKSEVKKELQQAEEWEAFEDKILEFAQQRTPNSGTSTPPSPSWKSVRELFLKADLKDPDSSATRDPGSKLWTLCDASPESDGLFEDATRLAVRLLANSRDVELRKLADTLRKPRQIWLDLMRTEQRGFKRATSTLGWRQAMSLVESEAPTSSLIGGYRSGIVHVFKESADFCADLASQTELQEATGSVGPATDPSEQVPPPGERGQLAHTPEVEAAATDKSTVQAPLTWPDKLPLPELPVDLHYQLAVARADALVTLQDELDKCWCLCFPVGEMSSRTPQDPNQFFTPFVDFGVARYAAWAEALIALRPPFPEYEAWLNFALKTLVCDELAPYRSAEDAGRVFHDLPPSEWQLHMSQTWNLFDHPRHAELSSNADRLINALEDSSFGARSTFLSNLDRALSRRRRLLFRDGLKRLGPPQNAPEPRPTADESGLPNETQDVRASGPKPTEADECAPDTHPASEQQLGAVDMLDSSEELPSSHSDLNIVRDRRQLVDKFLEACNGASDLRITRTHIWRSVGHKAARQFEYWQAGKDCLPGTTRGATRQDDLNFRRVLATPPEAFVAKVVSESAKG